MNNLLKKYYLDSDMKLVKAGRFPNADGEVDAWFENDNSQSHRCIEFTDVKLFNAK